MSEKPKTQKKSGILSGHRFKTAMPATNSTIVNQKKERKPEETVQKSSHQQNQGAQCEVCIVCFESITDKSQMVPLNCGHIYHLQCFQNQRKKQSKNPQIKCSDYECD